MKKLTLNTVIFAIVAIGLLVWVIDKAGAVKSPEIAEYAAPADTLSPIQSAYRVYDRLVINVYPQSSETAFDKEFRNGVYVVDLVDGPQKYHFFHGRQKVEFEFRREKVAGVVIEFILYKGKRISVKVNEVW